MNGYSKPQITRQRLTFQESPSKHFFKLFSLELLRIYFCHLSFLHLSMWFDSFDSQAVVVVVVVASNVSFEYVMTVLLPETERCCAEVKPFSLTTIELQRCVAKIDF